MMNSKAWSANLKSGSRIVAIGADDQYLVLGLADGTIYAIQPSNGAIIGNAKVEGQPVQIAVDNAEVFVSTKPFPVKIPQTAKESKEILALNMLAARKTGSTLWKLKSDAGKLSVSASVTNTGGFVINGNSIYACSSEAFNLKVFDRELNETYTTKIKGEPVINGPWFSSVTVFDKWLLMFQEDTQIRLFDLSGKLPVEKGILKPADPSHAYSLSINVELEKTLRVLNSIVCITDHEAVVIDFSKSQPKQIDDRIQKFSLKDDDLLTVVQQIRSRNKGLCDCRQ